MGAISYNSQAIIPAPFVNVTKTYQAAGDGKIIGSIFELQVRGTLVAYKGSPNSSKVFWTLSGYPPDEVLPGVSHFTSILRKQEALRTLFATEGLTFQIQPYDGAAPITCNPRVKRIAFQEGNWFDLCKYEIDLEADVLYVSGDAADEDDGTDVGNYKVEKATHDWSLEVADDKFLTYRLTHRMSAQGKRFYLPNGTLSAAVWQNAQAFVLAKSAPGIDLTRITGSIVNLNPNSAYNAYNYVRSENISIKDGTYGITETWLLYAPATSFAAIDEFTVVTRIGQDGLVECSIDGTLTGLQVSNNTTQAVISTKYTNAIGRFGEILSTIFARAQNNSGFTLNSIALTQNVTRNIQAGIVTYAYTYNNRPAITIPGAISESIQVSYVNPKDVFAIINVLARPIGPILQAIGSITENRRTLALEAQMPASSLIVGTAQKPDTSAILASYKPTSTTSLVFIAEDTENFNDRTGRYSRTTSWVYTS